MFSTEPWSGHLLSLYFGEDFWTLLLDMFKAVRQDNRWRLMNLLRDKSMYVVRRRGVLTRGALYLAAQDELVWPAGDSEGLNRNSRPTSQERNVEQLSANSLRAEIMPEPASDLNSYNWGTSLAVKKVLKSYQQKLQKRSRPHEGNLQTEFELFCERCDQGTLPQQCRHLAFLAMCTGLDLNLFLTHVKENCKTIHDMEARIKERFVTRETTPAFTWEWESMDLV